MTLGSMFGFGGGVNKNSSPSANSGKKGFEIKKGTKNRFFHNVKKGEFRKAIGDKVRVNRETKDADDVRNEIGSIVGRRSINEGEFKKILVKNRYEEGKRGKIISFLRGKYAKESLKEEKPSERLTILNKKSPEKPPVRSWLRARDETSIGLKEDEHGRITVGKKIGSKQISAGQFMKAKPIANANNPEESRFGKGLAVGQASVSSGDEDNVSSISDAGRPAKLGDQKPANEKPTDIKLAA